MADDELQEVVVPSDQPAKHSRSRIAWRRIIVEGIAIIVSILMAFSIDAWWDSLGERERRLALLRGLDADFARAASDLERVRGFHQRVVDAAEAILEFTELGTVSAGSEESFDSLVTNLLWEATFDPPMGTLQALLSSGSLDVLDDHELSAELTSWQSLVENLQREEALGEAQALERLHPYLAQRIRERNLYTSDVGLTAPWQVDAANVGVLVSDIAFENLVVRRWDIYTIALRALAMLENSTARVQELLDSHLASQP